jgi:hypothetical protein
MRLCFERYSTSRVICPKSCETTTTSRAAGVDTVAFDPVEQKFARIVFQCMKEAAATAAASNDDSSSKNTSGGRLRSSAANHAQNFCGDDGAAAADSV